MIKKSDIIIIVLAIIIAGGFFVFNSISSSGDVKQVRISIAGKLYKTVSLSEPQTIQIAIEGRINTIQIDNKGARMIEANCPDHICVKQGKITKKNQTIVCLPNKVVVEFFDDKDSEFDAISE